MCVGMIEYGCGREYVPNVCTCDMWRGVISMCVICHYPTITMQEVFFFARACLFVCLLFSHGHFLFLMVCSRHCFVDLILFSYLNPFITPSLSTLNITAAWNVQSGYHCGSSFMTVKGLSKAKASCSKAGWEKCGRLSDTGCDGQGDIKLCMPGDVVKSSSKSKQCLLSPGKFLWTTRDWLV